MSLLHYSCLSEFKKNFYKDKLTRDHLQGGMIELNRFSYSDGRPDEEVRFWGWELKKGNESFLLPGRMGDKEIKLQEILPILVNASSKVGSRGKVYNRILRLTSVRFKPMRHMKFKELVDKLTSNSHSNPEHYKLLWFIGLTSIMDRAYFRVCSPPSFGKSSVVDTLGHLMGDASKIVKPTLAKLEHRTSYKWLVLDEANDLPAASWKDIDQFLLDVAAFSPMIEKHSRAYGDGKESYDVSEFSISLFYNDVTDYPEKSEYFDTVTKRALRDRFPAFRVHGGFTEDFNKIRSINVEEFVKDNEKEYKKIIETLTYFKQNKHQSLHWWSVKPMQHMPERWKSNIDKLLKIIDLYCDSQEEFDHWVGVVSASIQDYYEMSKFPPVWEKARKKLSSKDLEELKQLVKQKSLFKDKVDVVVNFDSALLTKDVRGW